MARLFEDLYAEDRRQATAQTDYTRSQQYAATASPQTAAASSDVARMYPWVTPGANLALAKSGVSPDSPAAQLVAQTAAARKRKKGFGWRSIGDVARNIGRYGPFAAAGPGFQAAKAVAGKSANVGSAVGSAVTPDFVGVGVKGAARSAFTVLESGTQYVDAFARGLAKDVGQGDVIGAAGKLLNPGAQLDLLGQTSAGIAAERLVNGQKVQLGTGYLPGGTNPEDGGIKAEQARRALAAYSVGGRAGTPGRILANLVTEPGTSPYNVLSGLVDGAVDIVADPFIGGLGKTSKARAAAKSLVDVVDEPGRIARVAASVGLVNGVRPAVITNRAEQWLKTGDGSKVVDFLAANDFTAIRQQFKGKLGGSLEAKLADASTRDDVLDILRPELGISIREAPNMGGLLHSGGVKVRKQLEGVRLLGTMPGKHIDIEDVDGATTTLDRMLLNAKMPDDTRKMLVEKMARSTDRIGRYNIVADSLQQMATHIGGDPASAKRMTRMFSQYNERLAAYFLDEVGQNAPILGATMAGSNFALPVPHLFNEYILRALPLPDARDIRVATSRLKVIRDTAGVNAGVSALDWLSQDVWKPMVLLRGAWTVRVVGEEQVRMAASGLRSVINHPISAIAWATGRKGSSGITGDEFADAAAAAGDLDEFAQAMSRRGGGWADRQQVLGRGPVRKDEEWFTESWADELAQLNGDPIAKRVAGGWSPGDAVPGGLTGNHAEDAKAWFWHGPGKTFRQQLGQANGREGLLTDKAIADEYINSIQKRLEIKTHGQADLIDAVATGRINGELIRNTDNLKPSEKFLDHLDNLVVGGNSPDVVKGEIKVQLRSGAGAEFLDMKDKAVETLFSTLMSRPTNLLSRSPAFRQFYWKRAEELLPKMTREAQEATLRAAKEAGLERNTLRSMAKRMGSTGDLNIEDADVVAKGFGLDKTRELLYDLTERSQFFDITRHIFPFGEAWMEMGTRWAKIGWENPEVIRRGQQVVEGARGSGFFYTNADGEEVFAYPGSEFVTRQITGGVPVPLTGSVQGLNLFSKNPLMPGVGPVVQVAAGKILPDKPEWEWARDLILPFGPVDMEERGIIETFLPAWSKKWQQAWGKPADQRLFANTVMDIARYLESTGQYDLSSESGKRALEDAARSKARTVYAIRGAAQFFAPSAPSPEFLVKDKDGRALVAVKLVEEYRELQDKDYDSAIGIFMDKYGEKLSLLIQPKSEGSSPTNSAAADWMKQNKATVRDFPEVYKFFTPKGGEFDFDAYNRSFETGERKALTPAEQMDRANDRIAGAVYSQAKTKFPPNPNAQQRAVLKMLQDALMREYPGYSPIPRDMGATERQVRQLEDATKDPKLAKTDVGQALTDYFAGRDLANAKAKQLGLTSAAAGKAARPLRNALRALAAAITREHPDFAEVWSSVLERELATDAEELPA